MEEDREREPETGEAERAEKSRRRKAGALAAVFAGSLLAQLAAMFASGRRKKKDDTARR